MTDPSTIPADPANSSPAAPDTTTSPETPAAPAAEAGDAPATSGDAIRRRRPTKRQMSKQALKKFSGSVDTANPAGKTRKKIAVPAAEVLALKLLKQRCEQEGLPIKTDELLRIAIAQVWPMSARRLRNARSRLLPLAEHDATG